MEVERSLRYRIQISRGMKGGISFEAVTDGTGYTQDEILEKSDALVAQLEARYPAQEEIKK